MNENTFLAWVSSCKGKGTEPEFQRYDVIGDKSGGGNGKARK